MFVFFPQVGPYLCELVQLVFRKQAEPTFHLICGQASMVLHLFIYLLALDQSFNQLTLFYLEKLDLLLL
jgi:hypothetical protein